MGFCNRFDIKINHDDIRNFFFKKTRNKKVITKRILGISLKYVHGKDYKDFIGILKYISPFLENSDNCDIDNIMADYKKKSEKYKIAASIYLDDRAELENLIGNIKPESLPKATGFLRNLQLETLKLANEIISDIEENTDINIWLDGGCLLGAIRDGGFIPWDDDMDFAMLREDYKKFEKYVKDKYITIDTSNWTKKTYSREIKKYVKQYENQIIVVKTFDAFKLIKGTPKNFAIVDFFVWDYFNDYHNVRTLQKYCDSIKAEMDKIDTYDEIFKLYDRELNNGIDIVSKSDVLAPGIDNHGFISYDRKEIVRHSDIFPLTKIKFEDCEFKAPNNSHIYLKSLYDFYNKIPLDGLKITAHVNVKVKGNK